MFFDNLLVTHTKGPLVEETDYYPFGLTMSGISSKAAGSIENRRKFNDGTELNSDFDINLYETNFRSYDAQIGRFHQMDKIADFFESFSPYIYAYNDPSGLSPTSDREDNPSQNLMTYVHNPFTGQIIFDPKIHNQDDIDPQTGLIYLGERLILTRNGVTTWWDENGKSSTTDPGWNELAEVTMISKKKLTFSQRMWEGTKLAAGQAEFLSQGFSYSMVNKFGWHDAKGKWHYAQELEKNLNGVYLVGVQGKRLSLKSASQVAKRFKH